ncbi:MAG: hypothetical protein FWH26_10400 [Oscillospiraceae bacterium]|nr:hypothetical protein [Oscillospiraceae bacterium]
MEQEYPFRPRGRHGFDRDDVINYISQAQLRCNEHLARMEELETAKQAWYTQAKSMEREKNALVARNRELEEQLSHDGVSAVTAPAPDWMPFTAPDDQELAALKARCLELEEQLVAERARAGAQAAAPFEGQDPAAQGWLARISELEGENSALTNQLRAMSETLTDPVQTAEEANALLARIDALEAELRQQRELAASLHEQTLQLEREKEQQAQAAFDLKADKSALETAQRETASALETSAEALDASAAALEDKTRALEEARTAWESDRALLEDQLRAMQARLDTAAEEKAAFERQLPSLEAQLAQLSAAVETTQSESGEQLAKLLEEKEALVLQLAELTQEKEQLSLRQAELTVEKERLAFQLAELSPEKEKLAQQTASLDQEKTLLYQRLLGAEQAEAAARQAQNTLSAEAGELRDRVKELERAASEQNADVLRSMVLASFNYSNLYVENNLKTAQVISDATSRNIGRVSDSASSLVEQLDTVTRGFNETTDQIRRNLSSFQRELGLIQSGMNKRLSQDRFSPLLAENEKLRAKLETEILAELSAEDEAPYSGAPHHDPVPQPLPFAEDLPATYSDYLD